MARPAVSRRSRFQERLEELGHSTYAEYLRSPHWQAVRSAHAAKYPFRKCFVCAGDGSQLHHPHYRSLGEELPEELVWLCEACHKNVHEAVSTRSLALKDAHVRLKNEPDFLKVTKPHKRQKKRRGRHGRHRRPPSILPDLGISATDTIAARIERIGKQGAPKHR